MIEILSASALATVQDLGRAGALRWGVGTSGAMDPLALAAGNVLLGNDEGAAAVEVPVFPFQARFAQDCAFAVTGADVAARLDDTPVLPWWSTQARAGQVQPVLGSRSTQLRGAFGGHEGRALRQGDTLRFGISDGEPRSTDFGVVPAALALPLQVDGLPAMRVLPAAEYTLYSKASRAAFWADPWKITAQSDRYGYRLDGTPLEAVSALEMRSHGIVPGVIQVPPGGQPIVQMRDAQPSGGYPKLGTVIEADLWRLGQAPIGSRVRFIETNWDDAVAALAQTRRWLDEVHRLVELHRTRRVAT
jgi:allophanate hydrolase subunit 2